MPKFRRRKKELEAVEEKHVLSVGETVEKTPEVPATEDDQEWPNITSMIWY